MKSNLLKIVGARFLLLWYSDDQLTPSMYFMQILKDLYQLSAFK